MIQMSMRLRAAAALLPILFLVSACDIAMAEFREQETAEWRKTFDFKAGGRVEISNVNGKIDVRPAEGNTVEFYAKRIAKAGSKEAAKEALERIQIVDSSEGGVIKVETKINRGSGGMFNHSQVQVEYTVRVPATAQIKVGTVNGGVEITGLSGRITAETTNGGIVAHDIAGELEATTTNGGLEVDLAAVPEGGVKLECTNGGIELRVPKGAKATIAARVANGGIDTGGLDLVTRGEATNRRLDADMNGGGPRISLEGTNGGIKISAR